MSYLESYLQRRTERAGVSFIYPEENEMGIFDMVGENTNTSPDQKIEGGSGRKEQPAGSRRRGKRQKLNAVNVDQECLDSLKDIGKRMEETNGDPDRMFLLSLVPAMKQLSPTDNLDFRVEVQETLRRKLRPLATVEVQVVTNPSVRQTNNDIDMANVGGVVCTVIVLLVCWSLVCCARGELYTCLADMEELLETEALLMQTLDGYIQAQEEKLQMLRRHAAEYAREHEEASQDVQRYLSNPINAYLLVKRLTTDWKEVETQMVDDVGKDFVQNITTFRDNLKFPSDEDLSGAAIALMRLQDTYRLDTASVARGELNGVQYSTELSAGDCFELGRQSYNIGDFYHTVLWMTEALERYEEEYNKTVAKSDILEYLAFSTYKQGNVHRALKLTNELLEIVPTHQRALGNKVYYLQDIENASKEQKRGDDGTEAVQSDQIFVAGDKQPLHERDLYEMHCRMEHVVPADVSSKLKCRYTDRGSPFLRLARVKEEEASLKPLILIFHDIIYDAEIETIKKLSMPRFKRATVQNSKTGQLETANYRISKSAWLRDEFHPHVAAVNRRVEHVTGLTTSTAEELQVVNYGIGGHYEPHFDFARKEERNAFKSLGTGNRIATFLFYMSDVSQGGATVFPQINVALRPEKGAAAFWYNLHPNGEGDVDTRHAACPVLTGSKWVSNKWLHEIGQEFRRPCGPTFDAD